MTSFARKNELGWWVGWIRYDDGSEAPVTNAFHAQSLAEDVATRIVESVKNPNAGKINEVGQ